MRDFFYTLVHHLCENYAPTLEISRISTNNLLVTEIVMEFVYFVHHRYISRIKMRWVRSIHLTTVEWVGFKLTFLEKDICHDHEIDILRSLAKLQLRYV